LIAAIAAVVGPALLALGFTVVAEVGIGKIAGPALARSIAMMVAGLASATLICVFNAHASAWIPAGPPFFGTTSSFLAGTAAGTAMSVLAALLFFLAHRPAIGSWRAFLALPCRMMANVFPAAVEESGFRAGLVHALDGISGAPVAALGGSISFGLAHLLGRAFGRRCAPMHLLGATCAGLLFSVVYLRRGLLCAVAIHWSWNSLVRCWTDLFKLEPGRGVEVFEGAWTTVLLTLGVAVVYLLSPLASGR